MDVKKIKVLHIINVGFVVKNMLLPLINKLEENKYEVHIICSNGEYVKELKERGYRITTVKLSRKISLFSNLNTIWRIYAFIRKERPMIVHTHAPVMGLLGRVAAKLAGSPVIIYTAHGFYFHENMNWCQRMFFILIELITGRLCTDMLFTQSKEDADFAFRKGIIAKEKIEWIGNGVDLKRFSNLTEDRDLKSSLGIDEKDKVIGFIGRIVREKGVEELILSLKQVGQTIPNVKLLIVGDTLESDRDQGAKERIKQLIDINGLTNKVIFIGFREEIPQIYKIMDVFVLPSHREGMPRTVLEAMASGKPVIATNIRGCREEVLDGVTGLLVPVKDSTALTEAIKQVLLDERLANKMGLAGYKRAQDSFDENQVIDKEMKIYQRLLQDKIGFALSA